MNRRKILIADDDQGIRMLLEHFFNTQYDVTVKENGMEALKWMQKGNIPDFIIVDVVMPELDGYDFIRNVRTSGYFKRIPIIMLSGLENSEEKIKCLKLGADDYMVKPFNPEELSVRIENIFKRVSDFYSGNN
ncbi:response regulator transcription factor [Fulvivirgaceae bacterium BMA12]|uniref:Response regulator transcription factor n=1 Tax=Agaribacillus aureus TaxID=3051825 RepID=A0ABT8L1W5_9BACT|nr:response regulator transcription factor [Fulvivirgaceae bacterium BMA12]